MSDILLVPVEGDLDVTTVPRLKERLEAAVEVGCRRVILNMADVSYIDSMGVALVFMLARDMRAQGGLLSLSGVGDDVYHTLVVTCLVDFVPVLRRGHVRSVPVLDPSVRPLWRRVIPVNPMQLGRARDRLSELLSRLPLGKDAVFDMTLAGGEALGNAIDHTCAEGVLLVVLAYPDRVVVEVSDCGEGFELAQDEEPEQSLERGRGIKLMRMLADSVTIGTKSTGEGTVVRLVKLLDPMAPSV
ncbi:MAG: anti-sigma factor antagonist [Atopobiaceae bacterium]|nr:anti-sigma factor antagonist [Atopobiaceae bacterium]MDD3177008.1 anti-sigma factor antagonist [Atopobiaceae bacterium]MDD4380954.1 anti-sigma factor antagonist [Atopobiaceae bacterium]